MTLQLRPDCERCGRDLLPDSDEARICTFECTFCAECVEGALAGVCPNCGGNFERRPIRPAEKLAAYPASTERKGPRRPSPLPLAGGVGGGHVPVHGR